MRQTLRPKCLTNSQHFRAKLPHELEYLDDKPRAILGDNKRDENPLYGHFLDPILSHQFKVAQSGLKWLKVAYSVPQRALDYDTQECQEAIKRLTN